MEFAGLERKRELSDDPAGFADACDGAAAEAEVHCGLALAGDALPTADEMGWRDGAGDEEDPDVGVERWRLCNAGPSGGRWRVFSGREAELGAPEAVGDEAVEAGAFVQLRLKWGRASPL